MDYFNSPEGYIQKLKRQRREQQHTKVSPSLTEQINQWWEALPPEEQHMEYSMEFFANRFGATRQKLGVTLFALGWQRNRRWSINKPHSRYWVKVSERW